jgi:hypothetical protein
VEAAQIFSVVEEIGDSGWLGFATEGTKRSIALHLWAKAGYPSCGYCNPWRFTGNLEYASGGGPDALAQYSQIS